MPSVSIQPKQWKSGRVYYLVWREHGRQRWERAGKSKRVAREKRRELEQFLEAGEGGRSPSFEDLCSKWLADRKGRVAPATYEQYQITVTHAKAVLSGRSDLIKTRHIERFVRTLAIGRTPKTVNRNLSTLKCLFGWAAKRRLIRSDPTILIEPLKRPRTEKLVLAADEARTLLAWAPDQWKGPVALVVYGALRPSEWVALKRRDINWKTGEIHVKRSRRGETKTKSSEGTVVVPVSVLDLLPDDLFPCGKRQTYCPNAVRHALEPICEAANIPRVTWRDLRRTAITLMLSTGQNLKDVQGQARHASGKMTVDEYGQEYPADRFELAEKMAQLLA